MAISDETINNLWFLVGQISSVAGSNIRANDDYVDILKTTLTNVVLESGAATGSPDTAAQIVNKLETLTGNDRLAASAIRDTVDNYVNSGTLNISSGELTLVRTGTLSSVTIDLSALLDLSNHTSTGDIDVNGQKIINLGTPTLSTDAVTKTYVDSIATLNRIHVEPVLDKDLLTPPGSPVDGDRYIVAGAGGTATGLWTGEENNIAQWNNGTMQWDFTTPVNGTTLSVIDEQNLYVFETTTSTWVNQGGVSTHNSLSGLQGGTANEYFHLTNAQLTLLNTVASTDVVGVSEPSPDTLRFTRRDATTFDLVIGTSTFPEPSAHGFSIDIASRVDVGTDLNVQHTVTYSVTNRNSIQSVDLIVVTGTNQSLTVPTVDGQTSETVTLSGINTSVAGSVTFNIRITDTQNGTHDSNVVTITIQNPPDHQQAHFGFILSTQTAADIVFATNDIEARDQVDGSYTVSGIPIDSNVYRIYMAVPTALGQVTSIFQGSFNITSQFTNVVQTIDSQDYNIFLMNVGSAVNSNYNGTVLQIS